MAEKNCILCFHYDVCYAVGGMTERAETCTKYVPAADVAPVKHGQWLSCDFGGWGCSECSCWIEDYYGDRPENYTYCPHCGAKMEVVRE